MPLDLSTVHKVFFAINVIIAGFAMSSNGLAVGYLYTQAILAFLGIWAIIDKENSEPLYLHSGLNVVSIILDSVILGISWKYIQTFSGVFAIILIIFKPILAAVSFSNARTRDGQSSVPTFGNWSNQAQSDQSQPKQSQQFSGGYQAV